MLKIEAWLMSEDLGFLLGRQHASADVVEAVLAADEHCERAAGLDRSFRRRVNFVRAPDHRPHGARRSVHHGGLAGSQSQRSELRDEAFPVVRHQSSIRLMEEQENNISNI